MFQLEKRITCDLGLNMLEHILVIYGINKGKNKATLYPIDFARFSDPGVIFTIGRSEVYHLTLK